MSEGVTRYQVNISKVMSHVFRDVILGRRHAADIEAPNQAEFHPDAVVCLAAQSKAVSKSATKMAGDFHFLELPEIFRQGVLRLIDSRLCAVKRIVCFAILIHVILQNFAYKQGIPL